MNIEERHVGVEKDNEGASVPLLVVGPEPEPLRQWWRDVWGHRSIVRLLAVNNFQVAYKRAVLGVLWAVAVPMVQAAVVAIVFSRIAGSALDVGDSVNYGGYVLTGVVPFTYFNSSVTAGSTAIVDGSALADKIWFPRATLVFVPLITALVGFGVSLSLLFVVLPLLGVYPSVQVFILIPAVAFLFIFSTAVALLLSAIHVYIRDVRFVVQAAMVLLFYVTPIAYPRSALRGFGYYLDLNPLTGVLLPFRMAFVGADGPWIRPVSVSIVFTAVVLAIAVEVHRRRDRLFIDLL